MSSPARATGPRVWAISTASWTAIALVQSLAAFVDRVRLEPHFLFNALNAISELMRGASKPLALSALRQLSALLRYALT